MLSSTAIPTDAVLLKPAWSALLASVRFAGASSWRFGNGAALLRCRENVAQRRSEGPIGFVGVRFRFDLRRWSGAFARSTGAAREIGFVADDGSRIASLHLEQVEGAIDELIWRLIDDDAARAPVLTPVPQRGAPRERNRIADELALAGSRAAFDAIVRERRLARADALTLAGPNVARRLAPTVLGTALDQAQRAGLCLRTRIENAGGDITWSPARAAVDVDAHGITLHGGGIDVRLPAAGASIWAIALETPDVCCPAIECCVPDEVGWIRLDIVGSTDDACAIWRRICATLHEE